MTLSVIIPYFNPDSNPELERLLIRAIKSASDNLSGVCEYELIVVNDGSPSDPDISSTSDSIRYIRREHGMLGAARNTGIENSAGQLITFLDADDLYFPNSLGPCIKAMEDTGIDLLGFGMKWITDNGTDIQATDSKPVFGKPVSGNVYMRSHNLFGSACRYLIRSSLIKDNGLRFMENAYKEDEEFTPRMMHFSKRYIETAFPVYAYCIRKGSIITDDSKQMTEAKSADTLKALSHLLEFRQEHRSEPHEGLDRKISYLAMDHIRVTLRRNDWRTAIEEQTKALASMGLFPLQCENASLGFRFYSTLSRSKAGLRILNLAEKFYK